MFRVIFAILFSVILSDAAHACYEPMLDNKGNSVEVISAPCQEEVVLVSEPVEEIKPVKTKPKIKKVSMAKPVHILKEEPYGGPTRFEFDPANVEASLDREPVYHVLFTDIPKDKQRFVDEYKAAYTAGGMAAVYEKMEEMKVIMNVNHLQFYIYNAPTDLVIKHIRNKAALERKLYEAPGDICKRYQDYSGNFKEAWTTAGDKTFLNSLRYIPEMIVAAHGKTEKPPGIWPFEIRDAEYKHVQNIWKLVADKYGPGNKIYKTNPKVGCYYRTLYLEELLKLPPEKAAMIWKLDFWSFYHTKKVN